MIATTVGTLRFPGLLPKVMEDCLPPTGVHRSESGNFPQFFFLKLVVGVGEAHPFAIIHNASAGETIAPSPPGFLDIIFHRLRGVHMDDEADVSFVHPHAESDRTAHDLYFSVLQKNVTRKSDTEN